MKTSDRGINLIAEFEGFESRIYNDAAGYATIGFGHLLKPGEHARFKNGISRQEGVQLLREDIKVAEKAVSEYTDVDLSQNEFDALVSFTFNLGGGAFRRSTLLRKLNEGDRAEAADQLLRWNRAGGRVLRGLTRRREAERTMFLGA